MVPVTNCWQSCYVLACAADIGVLDAQHGAADLRPPHVQQSGHSDRHYRSYELSWLLQAHPQDQGHGKKEPLLYPTMDDLC